MGMRGRGRGNLWEFRGARKCSKLLRRRGNVVGVLRALARLLTMAKASRRNPSQKRPRGPVRCRVDGAKLRALREDAELSIRELAYSVGVDPKTITDLEAGRRDWSQVRVIRSIASHPQINVDWKELVLADVAPSSEAPTVTNLLPARSSLDAYVAEERRIGKLPSLTTAIGDVPSFGAAELAKVFSSPGSQVGARFYVRGRVHAHRGLSVADGQVLGIRHRDGSRFEVIRTVGALPVPLSIMVITTTVGHTRALLQAWEAQREVVAIVRVLLVDFPSDDPDHVVVTNLDGGADHARPRRVGGEPWRGFIPIYAKTADSSERAAKPHPWALVVESIASESLNLGSNFGN